MKATPASRRFLHAACRLESTRGTAERVSVPLDWQDIVDRAWRLGVISHLYHFVRDHMPEAPADVHQRLSALHLRQAADGVMVHEQLRETTGALHQAGIPVIVLKGAALALGVYQDVAVRPMRDLDLLIQADQLAAADAVLTAQGYRPDEFYRPRDWWIEHHHHLIPLVREGRPVPVELHRDIVPPSSGITTDIAGLWARAEPASVADVPICVLSRADLLLHLCQHLDRLVGRLGSLRDIAEVIRQSGTLDWQWIVSAAIQSGSASRAYCALRLAGSIAGAAVPGSALAALRRASGFNGMEDRSLELIAERALTWTDTGGLETALLTDLGSALLGGTAVTDRLGSVAAAFRDRWVAFRHGRASARQAVMAIPAHSSNRP